MPEIEMTIRGDADENAKILAEAISTGLTTEIDGDVFASLETWHATYRDNPLLSSPEAVAIDVLTGGLAAVARFAWAHRKPEMTAQQGADMIFAAALSLFSQLAAADAAEADHAGL